MEATNGDGGRVETALRIAAWGGAALLFAAPVVAEQAWAEMAWSAGDFVFWGVMLLLACGVFELTMRLSRSWAYRFGAWITIGAGFLLVLVNGAVGVIGSEDNPANLLYLAVLALGLGGAVGAEFKPRGMARAAALMAVAMLLVGAVALASGSGAGSEPYWFRAIVGSSLVWAAAWLASAWLFRRAAREQAAAA